MHDGTQRPSESNVPGEIRSAETNRRRRRYGNNVGARDERERGRRSSIIDNVYSVRTTCLPEAIGRERGWRLGFRRNSVCRGRLSTRHKRPSSTMRPLREKTSTWRWSGPDLKILTPGENEKNTLFQRNYQFTFFFLPKYHFLFCFLLRPGPFPISSVSIKPQKKYAQKNYMLGERSSPFLP